MRSAKKGHEKDADELSAIMPAPQAIAVAVLALLAFGAIIGSVTNPLAQSAGVTTILVSRPTPPAPEPPVESAPVAARSPVPAPPPAPLAAPAPIAPPEAQPPETASHPQPPPSSPPELPPEPQLPPITHVFLIVLGDQGYEEAFGAAAPSPYLAKTLAEKGELLTNYYAVAQGDLANEVALLSGQGPTAQTVAGCPEYTDVAPGTVYAATVGTTEQVEGSGCVYPAATQTLPDQLDAAGSSWRAYVEDIGNGGPEQAATCRHPALGSVDPSALPVPGDAYETWRNPFVYFHSLVDDPECGERDVGLDRLAGDLKSPKRTPALSYIVPNACHDGSELPCAPGQPAGPEATESFLKTVVGEIEASDAYRTGGLIAITSAEAPQDGPNADPSSCCATPEYPNIGTAATVPPAPATGPVKPSGGGGRVGMLLISPFVEPGSVDESGYYNHFSMLRSIEELFGLTALGYAAEPAVTPFDETVYNKIES